MTRSDLRLRWTPLFRAGLLALALLLIPAALRAQTALGKHPADRILPGAFSGPNGVLNANTLVDGLNLYATRPWTNSALIAGLGGGASGGLTNNETRPVTFMDALYPTVGIISGGNITFTNKNYPGLYPQLLTAAEIAAINEQPNGGLVWNATTDRLNFRDTVDWKPLAFTDDVTAATNGMTAAARGDASGLTLGTLPDATFPATLPVASGANLTALNASAIASGTVPPARMPTPFAQLSRARTNTFNVLDYGADPTGVAMSDLAVQTAIDDAQTNGGVVIIPAGVIAFAATQPDNTYLAEGHKSVLNVRSNNVTIRGAGMERTELYLAANPPAQFNFFGSLNVTNVTIEDMTLNMGNHANLVDTTQFYYQHNVRFKNVRFKNVALGDAVDVQQGGPVFVEGCEFYDVAGNLFSTQDSLLVIRNCYGRGSGWDLEFRARDGAQVPASVLQSYSTQTRMSGCVFENFSVALDLYGGLTTIEDSYFYPTNTAAITNFWVGGGTLRMNRVDVSSAAAFSSGHLIAVNTNGILHITAGTYDGKRQIQATKPSPAGIAIRSAVFGSVTLNNGHAISLSDGTGALIANCTFLGNGYRAVSVDGPLPFHNVRIEGGIFNSMSVVVDTSASTNIFCDGAYFQAAGVGFWAGSGHAFQNNTMVGTGFPLNMGGAQNTLVENNQLDSIAIFSAQPVTYRGNRLANTTVSGTAAQINASRWDDNRTIAGLPLRSTTLTANYTNDAVDSVLVFNGANLTNTVPVMGVLNTHKVLKFQNLHSTPLEVTNATGAITFDGRLRFSVPPYSSREIIYNGTSWASVDGNNGEEVTWRVPLKAVAVNVAVAMTSEAPFNYADSMRFSTNGGTSINFSPQNYYTSNFVLKTVWQASAAGSYPQTIPLEYYANYFVNTSGRIFNQNHLTTNLVFTAANTLLTNIVAMNTGTNCIKELAIQVLSQNPVNGPQYLYMIDCQVTEKPNAP
jgi:hypothetical protein